jgi:DNA polymerase III epsilon subunit-like protein
VPFTTPIPDLSFVALDLETTGLVPGFDAITEIGAARFSMNSAGVVNPGPIFEELVNPERAISEGVARLTGIDDDLVRDARTLDQVLPDLMAFLASESRTVIVAHNARFDMGFVSASLGRLGLDTALPPAICTVVIARKHLPQAPRYGLQALVDWLGADDQTGGESVHHRALPDALHARNLLAHCVALVGAKNLKELGVKRTVFSDAVSLVASEVPAHMASIEAAIDQGLPVELNYLGGSKGRSRRPVQPLALFIQNATLYLRATCLVDLQDKSFRADRIRAVHTSDGVPDDSVTRED